MNIKNYKNLKKNKANFEPLTPIDFLKDLQKFFQIIFQLYQKIKSLLGDKLSKDAIY